MTQPELELGEEALSALTTASEPMPVESIPVMPGPSFAAPSDTGVPLTDPAPVPIPAMVQASTPLPKPTVSRPVAATKKKSSMGHSLPRSWSQRIVEQLRSRRVRVVLTLVCSLAVVALLGLNLRGPKPSPTDDEIGDLALSEFDNEFGPLDRFAADDESTMPSRGEGDSAQNPSEFVQTADWTSHRNSLPARGLTSSEQVAAGHPHATQGAWLTGQIEVDAPLSVMPASSRRPMRSNSVEPASAENIDRFPRLAP